VSAVRQNLKGSYKAKLWSDEQKLHIRHKPVGEFANQNKALNYPKQAM